MNIYSNQLTYRLTKQTLETKKAIPNNRNGF